MCIWIRIALWILKFKYYQFFLHRIESRRLEFLAKEIVKLFPNESEQIYYIPYEKENGVVTPAGGKLYNSYVHYRAQFKGTKPCPEKNIAVSTSDGKTNVNSSFYCVICFLDVLCDAIVMYLLLLQLMALKFKRSLIFWRKKQLNSKRFTSVGTPLFPREEKSSWKLT